MSKIRKIAAGGSILAGQRGIQPGGETFDLRELADLLRPRAGWDGEKALGDPREFTDDNSGWLLVVALVPPDTFFNPPAVFPLVVEQDPALGADIVFELYL
jgi:hypothetical protein